MRPKEKKKEYNGRGFPNDCGWASLTKGKLRGQGSHTEPALPAACQGRATVRD